VLLSRSRRIDLSTGYPREQAIADADADPHRHTGHCHADLAAQRDDWPDADTVESADDDQHADAPPDLNADRDGDWHTPTESDFNTLGHADVYSDAFADAQPYADNRHEYANADLHLDTGTNGDPDVHVYCHTH
jgi:hypothetical protein